jgi:hypothetical protein
MIENSIKKLQYLCEIVPELLLKIDEKTFSKKTTPEKWSKKQVLGHLIDSATNNHQRYVRAQFEEVPSIQYDQNKWNECNFYQEIDSKQIINFWKVYNLQLVEIIKRIPKENLNKQINVGNVLFTLEFIISDYVAHLEHHLKQIITY